MKTTQGVIKDNSAATEQPIVDWTFFDKDEEVKEREEVSLKDMPNLKEIPKVVEATVKFVNYFFEIPPVI
ncbi:MAG: hypothetical protein LBM95_07415 [Lactobacillales bacterium]|nr:hypothetical protein [Lactobacillales bacterium]